MILKLLYDGKDVTRYNAYLRVIIRYCVKYFVCLCIYLDPSVTIKITKTDDKLTKLTVELVSAVAFRADIIRIY